MRAQPHTIVQWIRLYASDVMNSEDGVDEQPRIPAYSAMETAQMMRVDYYKVSPGGVKALHALEQYLRASGLEPTLIELVKLRASLMNGCAYCVDVHTKDARAKGETEQRLFAVPVWRETPFFSPRERAALAWTEAVTDIGRNGVTDALYDEARAQFTEKELVDLSLAVIAINAWNRLAVTFRPAVGNYKPAVTAVAPA
jgi:AhpD family alkylhydroperoxidase